MPIPPFNLNGVLPPYVGPSGPGGAFQHLSPYQVSAVDVAIALGTTANRQDILRKWLDHRRRLRLIGLTRGFQWLDGSFVEQKDPNDLDIVTFTHRPAVASNQVDWDALVTANLSILERTQVKASFRLDAQFVDLNGDPEFAIELTRYFGGLFSHRRGDDLWKGMLKTRLEDAADDAAALGILGPPLAGGAVP
jgi:hypothetical protein